MIEYILKFSSLVVILLIDTPIIYTPPIDSIPKNSHWHKLQQDIGSI